MRKLYLVFQFLVAASVTFSQNYTILGSAVSMGGCNCFRLTPDAPGQGGAIYQNQTIDLHNSFDFTFSVFLGCHNGDANHGADGECFVLTSNPNGLGAQGEWLGYGNGSNQPCSVGIEFDTWTNSSHNDPSYDHIAIESGGFVDHNLAGPVSALTNQGNIDDCQPHTARVVWDAATSTYSVYFDGVLRLSYTNTNFVNAFFCGNYIVNWGWTAATGGGYNEQRVCVTNTSSWIAGVNYQSCDLAVQFKDISTSSLGSVQSWAWSFGDNTTSTLQNPLHTYATYGTYNVTLTITDISGCTNTYSHPVTINTPIVINPSVTPPPCNGGSNGGISATLSGGFGAAAGYGGYMYHWSDNTTGTTLVGAHAGNYTLTITDGVCTSTAAINVTQPPPLTATTSHTDADCGLTNGTATITISGGTPPYQGVNWGPSHPGSTATGLAGGYTYIADFTDFNGCSSMVQYRETIGQLPCGYSQTASSTNVTCFGGNNGTASVTVSGGVAPFNISWSNGTNCASNTCTANGLVAGSYTYTYTDGNGQNFNGTVTVTQPGAAIAVSVATQDMSCSGTNDGKAVASVTAGGNPPFTYAWSRGTPNGAVSSGLSPGAISVTVTDASGCTASASGNITGPPTLTINVTSIDDSCYQSHTGSATANVGGGNPPYTYFWNNISTAQTNLSLGIGTYTVTATDSKGCTITGSASINQAPPFSHTITSTNIQCGGSSTGTITVTPSGGTPGYTYTWNNGVPPVPNPTGLAAGQYNVTVTDTHRCQRFDSATITAPPVLTATTSHTDVTCFGANDGTITITVAGGTPPYSFLTFPVPPGTTTIPGLGPNTYSGNLTDANGCTVPLSETIIEPAQLAVTETHINILCNGGNNGSIDITVTGGTTPYTYLWNDGVTTEDRANIPAGCYSVTATDNHSCSVSISVCITEPTALTAAETHTNITCNGAGDGTITITTNGGTPAYIYTWNDGVNPPNRTGLAPNTYTVTVSDNNSCSVSLSINISEPPVLTVTSAHTDVKCHGGNDGTITVNIGGGTAPYTYLGNPVPAGSTTLTGFTANTYNGTITDAHGCTANFSETISEPGVQSLAVVNVTDNVCSGGMSGAITVNDVNPTGTVTYDWTPGGVQPASRTGLASGTYTITATDQNNCTQTATATINEPPAPVMTVTTTDAVCFGGNGTATANPSGGGTFTYTWSVGGNTQTINPPAGPFTVTATDVNSCNQTGSGTINQPPQLLATETHTDATCNGASTGSATVNASSGTPGYTYVWNPNVSSGSSAAMIPAASYSVTVTDLNGCTVIQLITIAEPLALSLSVSATDVLCNGGNTGQITSAPSGGTSPYSFSASDGTNNYNSANGTFSSLSAGNYTVTLTDANTCTATSSAIINQPPALTAIIDTVRAQCYNSPTGSIVVTPGGGTPGYTFQLSDGSSNATGTFTGLSAGTYSVSVTDANNCPPFTGTAVITQPDSVVITVTPASVKLNIGETVQISVTTNQSGILNYNWNPQQGLSCSDCPNPVFGGTYSQQYTVEVTTQGGCRGSAEFIATVEPDYHIFIPNVFTPNGDGTNDFWQLFGNLNTIKQLTVMVFNRWGEKVFESNDINFKWDGTFKGELAPNEVYVYVAKFVWIDNHSDDKYHGSVTLMR